jgi:hypothetical protein
VKRAFTLGCALLASALSACQQTWVLDDLTDAGRSGAAGASGDAGGKGGSPPSDASTDGHCFGGQTIVATADRPVVVVALDHSSEMTVTQLTGSNNSEFNEAVTDLSAQVGSYAPSGQHAGRRTLDFAYLEFPGTSACNIPGCCASTANLTDSYQMFIDATMVCDSPGNTCGYSTPHPMAAALSSANAFFDFGAGGSQAMERYVLVVTDDAPSGNCNAENDCQAAQDQVYALSSGLNVTTVFVYVGASPNNSCFPNLVDVQGGPPPYYGDNTLYYNATSATDLQNKIATAVYAMAQGACHFALSSTPSSPNDLIVSQGSQMPIPQDSKSGWSYDNENNGPRLILHGSACTNYLSNSQFGGIQVSTGCGPSHGSNP